MNAPRRRTWWAAATLAAGGLAFAAYHFAPTADPREPEPAAPQGPPLFRDVTADAGVRHTYRNGEDADQYAILESIGGGGALIDYDGDGLLDIFLAGGGHFSGSDGRAIQGLPCKLYRNLGGMKFADVTTKAGLDKLAGGAAWFYTHGGAVADYDRDGWPDLLVTGWGQVALFRNKGDGTFEDATAKAGLDKGVTWATSAAFADLDGDGFPDLYLCQYLDWSWKNNPPCSYDKQKRDVCPPRQFDALPHRLFRNNRDGTFVDVSKPAGLRVPREEKDYAAPKHLDAKALASLRGGAKERDFGKGLGVLAVDINGDGRPELYVANDTTDNFLYLNRGAAGQLLLQDVGLAAGVARDGNGSPNGSMGLDAADFDGSGRPSLWVTNYEGEMHALYQNDCGPEGALFNYMTEPAGIVALGLSYVGWGTRFLDLDHSGWPGLFISNGHAIRSPLGAAKRRQRPVLLRNLPHPTRSGQRKFVDISSQGGPYFHAEHCGRGVAFGDLDNDGRIDLVLNHLNDPVVVLRNEAPTEGRHWLGVDLRRDGQRCLVGTRVTLEVGGRTLTAFCKGGGSYLSANDARLTFGVGQSATVGRLTVYWAWGKPQHFDGLTPGRYWRLSEGGKAK